MLSFDLRWFVVSDLLLIAFTAGHVVVLNSEFIISIVVAVCLLSSTIYADRFVRLLVVFRLYFLYTNCPARSTVILFSF